VINQDERQVLGEAMRVTIKIKQPIYDQTYLNRAS